MAFSKATRKQLAVIRRHIAAKRCSKALKAYRKLPEAVRYDDSLGPLKASINRCKYR